MTKVDLNKFTKSNHQSVLDREVTASGWLQYPHIPYDRETPCCACGRKIPLERKYTAFYINWCNIRDHLIRLTAHYTDSYGSDMLYTIETIQHDLEKGEVIPHGYYLGFRENGVDHDTYITSKYENDLKEYRAIWRILITISDKKEVEMSLHRVVYSPFA